MIDSTRNRTTKTRTMSKPAGWIAPVIQEQALRDLKFYRSTKRMQRADRYSRPDVQDLVLLGLIKKTEQQDEVICGLLDEIRRLRPLQRRTRIGRSRKVSR